MMKWLKEHTTNIYLLEKLNRIFLQNSKRKIKSKNEKIEI